MPTSSIVGDTPSLVPPYHLVDGSYDGYEPLGTKRRRLELGKVVEIEAGGSGASRATSTPVLMADAILLGRPAYDRTATPRTSLVRSSEGGTSTIVGRPRVEADVSGSDVTLEAVNEFLGGHTYV